MNKIVKIVTCVLCASLLGLVAAAGKTPLSPAFDKLEKEIEMKKCGVANNAISFTKADFDDTFREKTEYVGIVSLPEQSAGTLYLSGEKVKANQVISRRDFGKLEFLPVENATGKTVFDIVNVSENGDTGAKVVLCVLDGVNLAPVCKEKEISTFKETSVYKFLPASDPEYDEMTFEVVSYPEHGYLCLAGDASGYFCYIPAAGYTGKDSFEYLAVDCYGNRGKCSKISINVSKPALDVKIDDMNEHWACNSVRKTVSAGLMNVKVDEETGESNFYPDETVTRGDFLALALITAGYEPEINFVNETGFDDDGDIPVNIKSYAEYARKKGIVTGYIEDGKTVFKSAEPISRAECAVIVDRILKLPDGDGGCEGFSDFSECPDWAKNAFSNLASAEIMNGTGYGEILPENLLTRAESAEILCNIENYSVSAFSTAKKSSKNLLNLFGLLS
jgi:hypothetical protein